MSFYDPFQHDEDTMDKAMKLMIGVILFLLLIGSCRASAVEPTPSLIENEMTTARGVIIYQRIKLGLSPKAANESVLKKCGWMKPENVIDVIATKMPTPKNDFELASDVAIVMEIACEDPST